MEAMDIQAVESKLSDVTVTAIPMSGKSVHKDIYHDGNGHTTISSVPAASPTGSKDKGNGNSKYAQLLAVIEEMGKEVAVWRTRLRWHTELSADSVEWCPLEPYTDVLVCGTYQLDKSEVQKKQNRLGKLYLFRIHPDLTEISPIETIETSGILDQKWCHHKIQEAVILALVTSDGCVQLYKLVGDKTAPKLQAWTKKSIGDGVLALSVDWSTNRAASSEPRLVVSDSGGNVTLLNIGQDLEVVKVWKAHGFEAWIAAFDYWNEDVFYTGGDDCVFRCYDARLPEVAAASSRTHGAGVTSIRSDAVEQHRLITGSYDESVRLWDTRALKRCTGSTDVGGGVWRLKWHPHRKHHVLVAAMYGGFRILNLNNTDFTITSEYVEHESIAYGADWKYEGDTVATCSFYDCKLHINDIDFEETLG